MTGDQRLIRKLEDVMTKLDSDELLAAYHLLDELVQELETVVRAPAPARVAARERTPRPPAAAAG